MSYNSRHHRYLLAILGISFIALVWYEVSVVVFDGRWHNAAYTFWIIPVGLLATLAFVISWLLVAPLVADEVERMPKDDFTRALIKTCVSTLVAAMIFRLTVPKSSDWFGDLGDYFNPPLALISVVTLYIALGLQREDLKSTREALALSRKQLEEESRSRKISDSTWIIINELKLTKNEILFDVKGIGGTPGINVQIDLYVNPSGQLIDSDLEGLPFSRATFAVVFANDSRKKPFSINSLGGGDQQVQNEVKLLTAYIKWENIHGVTFQYRAELARTATGTWLMSDRIHPLGGGYFREEVLDAGNDLQVEKVSKDSKKV